MANQPNLLSGYPKLRNDEGVREIHTDARQFECIGASPPHDHPHIYLDMTDSGAIVCPYCGTQFLFRPTLQELASFEEAVSEGWTENAGSEEGTRVNRREIAMSRTSSTKTLFPHAFVLAGVERVQPAGLYVVETDQEPIHELSFPAYRTVRTRITLAADPARPGCTETAIVDPAELVAARTAGPR